MRVHRRLGGALVFRDHRRRVNGGGCRVRARGQCMLAAQGPGQRPVTVGQGPPGECGDRILLVVPHRLGARDQLHEGAQVSVADLDDVIAFLAERPGDGPVAVHRNVHNGHSDAEILHVRDDLGEVLLGTDHQGIADRAVPGQGGQVAMNLALHTLAAARPHPAQPQLEPGQVSQRIVLRAATALNGRLVPVAAQQLEPGAFPGYAPEELEKAWVIPGNGLSVAGSVDGHRAIRQHVARVHEQRAPIHATPSFRRRETLPALSHHRNESRTHHLYPEQKCAFG